ncbi:MAG: endonuclease/exonuclease/phosphatase family protein [Leptolyngbyaceae cyanobacterium RM1_406_9]|nr:endonuclease/exonuclease/phosphatase family protein [Leptolyngbyaceae cyanobacterium RM1_406_9]
MNIVCLNGWGGKLQEHLIPYIHDTSPDILCLQEVVHTPTSHKDWLTYRDGDHILPQRANFFRDVSEALPDHVAVFCPAAQGILWDEEQQIPSQWGLATFTRKNIPIIGQVQGFVHKSFATNGYGEHPRSRSAHAIRVFDFEKDSPISIVHMHGLRDLNGKMDTPERVAQAHRLSALAQAITEKNDPLVVCGDFNVEPDSETFDVLKKLDLTDLVTSRGFTDTRTSHYKKPGRFADYMLVNTFVEVVSFQVVEQPEVSDHRPLVLEI